MGRWHNCSIPRWSCDTSRKTVGGCGSGVQAKVRVFQSTMSYHVVDSHTGLNNSKSCWLSTRFPSTFLNITMRKERYMLTMLGSKKVTWISRSVSWVSLFTYSRTSLESCMKIPVVLKRACFSDDKQWVLPFRTQFPLILTSPVQAAEPRAGASRLGWRSFPEALYNTRSAGLWGTVTALQHLLYIHPTISGNCTDHIPGSSTHDRWNTC